MSLEPAPKIPGLWIDQQAENAGPGTYAVVIGSSAYERLAGGDKPMSKLQFPGMQQLRVSALTAFHFFNWLRTDYHVEGCPLVRCWLLLAPSEDEKKLIDALTLAHALKPDFGGCNLALNDWFATMKNLSSDRAQDARASRSVFFFSGHGVEFHVNRQCLLPCDFPVPHEPGIAEQERTDKIIGTANLADAMSGLDVRAHFFFLDACRDDLQSLKGDLRLDGFPILPVPDVHGARSNSIFRFHATQTGNQAFQPGPPERTLFGQALLEGLAATDRLNPDCSPQACRVPAHKLMCYLSLRIPELLTENPGCQQRPACLFETDNPATVVTEVRPPHQPKHQHADPCTERRLGVGVSWAIDSLSPARHASTIETQRHLRPVSSLLRPPFAYGWTMWDVETGSEVENFAGAPPMVPLRVAVSRDGERIAFGNINDTVAVADAESGLIQLTFSERTPAVTAIAFSPEGNHIVTAGVDNSLEIWDALKGQRRRIVRPGTSRAVRPLPGRAQALPFTSAIAFSPDGRLFAPATRERHLSVWSAENLELVRHFEGHTDNLTAVAFHPTAPLIASGSIDGSVRIWRQEGGDAREPIRGEVGAIYAVAFSPDGRYIAIAGANEKVGIWSVDDGNLLKIFPSRIGFGTAVAFSPDGRFVCLARGVYTIDAGWPIASLAMARGRLNARWQHAKARQSEAQTRKRERDAQLIQERVHDLAQAMDRLRENGRQWLEQPVIPTGVQSTLTDELLAHLEVSELMSDREHPVQALDRRQIAIHRFDRQPGTNSYLMEIDLPPTVSRYWFMLRGADYPFACFLKPGTRSRTRFLIEMVCDGRDARDRFQLRSVQADISPANGGLLGEINGLWQGYHEAAQRALPPSMRSRIRTALENDRAEAEMPVILALLLTLRNGQASGTDDLIDRVGQAFPDSADIAALRVEGLYRRGQRWKQPPPGVVDALLAFDRLGLPQTGDGLCYLAERIDSTLRFHALTDAERQRLGHLRIAVRRAFALSRAGGLFCVFAGPFDQVDPLLLHLPR